MINIANPRKPSSWDKYCVGWWPNIFPGKAPKAGANATLGHVQDISGYGYHGKYQVNAGTAVIERRPARDWDGPPGFSDWVNLNSSSAQKITSLVGHWDRDSHPMVDVATVSELSLLISFWFYINTLDQTLFQIGTSVNTNRIYLFYENASNNLSFGSKNGGTFTYREFHPRGLSTWPLYTRYTCCFTYDSSRPSSDQIRGFDACGPLDRGSQVNSGGFSTTSANAIAISGSTQSFVHRGAISDVRIWNKAFSDKRAVEACNQARLGWPDNLRYIKRGRARQTSSGITISLPLFSVHASMVAPAVEKGAEISVNPQSSHATIIAPDVSASGDINLDPLAVHSSLVAPPLTIGQEVALNQFPVHADDVPPTIGNDIDVNVDPEPVHADDVPPTATVGTEVDLDPIATHAQPQEPTVNNIPGGGDIDVTPEIVIVHATIIGPSLSNDIEIGPEETNASIVPPGVSAAAQVDTNVITTHATIIPVCLDENVRIDPEAVHATINQQTVVAGKEINLDSVSVHSPIVSPAVAGGTDAQPAPIATHAVPQIVELAQELMLDPEPVHAAIVSPGVDAGFAVSIGGDAVHATIVSPEIAGSKNIALDAKPVHAVFILPQVTFDSIILDAKGIHAVIVPPSVTPGYDEISIGQDAVHASLVSPSVPVSTSLSLPSNSLHSTLVAPTTGADVSATVDSMTLHAPLVTLATRIDFSVDVPVDTLHASIVDPAVAGSPGIELETIASNATIQSLTVLPGVAFTLSAALVAHADDSPVTVTPGVSNVSIDPLSVHADVVPFDFGISLTVAPNPLEINAAMVAPAVEAGVEVETVAGIAYHADIALPTVVDPASQPLPVFITGWWIAQRNIAHWSARR